MKTKKLLSLLLCFVMLFGTLTLPAYADDATVTVYVTLSGCGEILTGKDGQKLALAPVTLYEESPNLDTVFKEFHTLYHENGADAYESYEGEYGTAISKLWEDDSELFGYQVNGGEDSVYGLSHTVKNGDYVDVCIYQNKYPATESYTRFNQYKVSAKTQEEITLNLEVAGYDENWNTVFSPCADAEITVDGELQGVATNEEGNLCLSFDEAGTYIVSAKKEKTEGESVVTAICAPVCVVTVKEDITPKVLENIAYKYSTDEFMTDGNAYWFAADMADFEKIYPEKAPMLSEESKQALGDNIVDMCLTTDKPGDLAKGIIALRSMGYDAKNTYDEKGNHFDIPQKLEEMIETKFEDVTNMYTLSYVIIALSQGEGYASEENINLLVNYAVENSTDWITTEYGTDAMTPMLLAVSPYMDNNGEIQSLIENCVETLEEAISKDGLIGNAPSTALAIAGLCSVGVNPEEIKNGDINLIDGLMSMLNENADGFIPTENTFATEQGMRALNAYMLFKDGNRIYSFSDLPAEEFRHLAKAEAVVVFETDPKSAKVTIDGKTSEDNTFYLEEGKYSYKVSKSGYTSKEGKITISKEEAEAFETITIEVELSKKSSGGGGGGGSYVKPNTNKNETPSPKPEETKTTDVVPIFPDIAQSPNKTAIEELCKKGILSGTDTGMFMPKNTVTRAEFTVMITKALELSQTESNAFADVKSDDWFAPYVNAAFENGIVAGVSATEFKPYGIITKEEAAAMLTRAAKLCNMDTSISKENARNILCQFADYIEISPWAYESMAFCYNKNILDVSELNSTPGKTLSREEIAQMIWNMITVK